MKYFDVSVTITVRAETAEAAERYAWLFMPWATTDKWDKTRWSTRGHRAIPDDTIDCWQMEGVDYDTMDVWARDVVSDI